MEMILYHPKPERYTDLLMQVLQQKGITDMSLSNRLMYVRFSTCMFIIHKCRPLCWWMEQIIVPFRRSLIS